MSMTEMTGLALDATLIVLLAAVLYACIRVNSRLQEMRKGQNELASLVDRLENATTQAKESIANLRKMGGEADDNLQSSTRKARAMADELTLITEAGNNLADRLEKKLTAKAARDSAETAGTEEKVTPIRSGRPDLLKALKEAR
ncbi:MULTISPECIES: DUF6468 domain-containing protein [unclassified Iodidimonas]|jgi:biopolymer transport protein ExbB/TolQ|uniref:DUF6468 domain-containing protein n=1 Tax=unclassified Iodidimonas TaxID=2626145 RepID=UPI0024821DC7|nr:MULTISPECIES: DUF6468 domain-containing protein [unclassified Iodidimonas]